MPSKKIKVGSLETTNNLTTSEISITGSMVVGSGDSAKTITNSSLKAALVTIPPGSQAYITPGTFTFVVPAEVTKLSALCIGCGGAGHYTWANSGGSGGGLAYANNIAVTPGESITIIVPGERPPSTGGARGVAASFGGYISASSGQDCAGNSSHSINTGPGRPISGSVAAYGGVGGKNSNTTAGGGGGAAGYSGSGGNGYYGSSGLAPISGSGGGGSGGVGYQSSTYGFGGGGGVGLGGEGASGVYPSLTGQTGIPPSPGNSFYSNYTYSGTGGSGGENASYNNNSSTTVTSSLPAGRTTYHGEGGRYGGAGGGGGTSVSSNGNFCKGAQGAVYVAWGGIVASNGIHS